MNTRAFSLSLIIAGIAMFMVWTYIEGREEELKRSYGKPVPVVIAKRDINELEVIDDEKVMIRNIPKNYVNPGYFKSVKDVYNLIATVPIKKGEQLSKPRLTPPGSSTGLSRQIALGKRAVSIRVSENEAVNKLIKPGDRVDILALIDYAGGRKELQKVKTVLQDVLVLATGYSITNSIPMIGIKVSKEIKTQKLNTYTNYNTVALELDPYQVQKLVFLDQNGAKLNLSLRNNDDKKIIRIKASKLFDLLGEDATEAKSFFNEMKNKKNRAGR